MTDDPPATPDATPPENQDDSRPLVRMETRLARAEAQIETLQEGMSDLNGFVRSSRQRALFLRIGLLVALLAAFFYLQYSK